VRKSINYANTTLNTDQRLHAMGPIPSDDGKELYFSDLTFSGVVDNSKPCLGRSAK
jgi:hypothetical protein